jgi:hypothetical protein
MYTLNENLCHIENDDAINCTINFQVHMENLCSHNSIEKP